MEQASVGGVVSEIQAFSVHDGDGIRSTVFLAGCPLRCRWCANPETWMLRGAVMTVQDVVRAVMRHGVFFRASGGGVTFSGGEACCQPVFLKGLIEAFDELGVDMALETAAAFHWEDMARHLERLSLIFADIKHMDSEVHRRLTGSGNGEILENIRRIGQLTVRTVIRIPLIPGINDTAENLGETARFVKTVLPGSPVELLPYHDYGAGKYKALGLPAPAFEVPSRQAMTDAREIIEREGVRTIDYL